MASFMQSMNNPSYRTNIEEKLAELKRDPELAEIMKEIEEGGPAVMTKYACYHMASDHWILFASVNVASHWASAPCPNVCGHWLHVHL